MNQFFDRYNIPVHLLLHSVYSGLHGNKCHQFKTNVLKVVSLCVCDYHKSCLAVIYILVAVFSTSTIVAMKSKKAIFCDVEGHTNTYARAYAILSHRHKHINQKDWLNMQAGQNTNNVQKVYNRHN